MANWYQARTSAGQGLVACDESGRNVAVTYDAADAPLVAAAPAMLAALQAIEANEYVMRLLQSQLDGTGAHICGNVRAAIAAATGER